MRILTLGDSWTYGTESSDPDSKSWPAQMSKKYNVDIVNLARGGSSNQRAARIGVEELCRDPYYDWVIFPLAPASRTEVLKMGKWHQIWPGAKNQTSLGKIYQDFWHPWNDVQNTLMLVLNFLSFVKLTGPKLYITGLSLRPASYSNELNWIINYKNDLDFNSLRMPLSELDIGISDLDRKLKSLKAIHNKIIETQPEYFSDAVNECFCGSVDMFAPGGHPNDNGYAKLADYFAKKIRLV